MAKWKGQFSTICERGFAAGRIASQMPDTTNTYETDYGNKQVQTTKHTKSLKMSQVLQDKRRKALSRETLASGIEMAPCSGCRNAKISSRSKVRCVVGPRSGRCSECIRKGRKCDVLLERAEWERLRDSRDSLQRRLQQAEEREEELQQQWAKQRAQVITLREQVRRTSARTDEEVADKIDQMEEIDRVVEEMMTGELEQRGLVENQALPFQWDLADICAGGWGHGVHEDSTEGYFESLDPSGDGVF